MSCVFSMLHASAAPVARAQEARSNQTLSGLLAPRPAPLASLDPELDSMARKLDGLARSAALHKPRNAAGDELRRSIAEGRAAIVAARAALLERRAQDAASKKRIAQAALELASRIAARVEETRAEAAAKNQVKLAQEARELAAAALAQAEARRSALQTALQATPRVAQPAEPR